MITIEVLTTEQKQLKQQESRIQQGLQQFFWEVGDALTVIREGRLYRSKNSTFEEYCKAVWGFSDQYARNLMQASKTVATLEAADVTVLPTSESQSRELSKLADPEAQIEAWMQATRTTAKPTAAQVKDAVALVKSKIDAASRPAAVFVPGATAKAVAGQHEAATVEVVKVESNGSIVHAKLADGKSYPFLAGELALVQMPELTPVAAKPSLKEENTQLKDLLRRIVKKAELPEDLLAEAKAWI